MPRIKRSPDPRPVCEIISLSNRAVGVGYVRSIDEDTVEIERVHDDLPLLRMNTTVKLSIRSTGTALQTMVGTVFISDRSFMRVVDVKSVSAFERRSFFRVSVDLMAYCVPYIEGEETVAAPKQSIPVRVVDISLSGFRMVCLDPHNIPRSELTYSILLPIHGIETIHFQIQRTYGDMPDIKYGCRFLGISERQIEILCGYIFQIQRAQINSAKSRRDSSTQ